MYQAGTVVCRLLGPLLVVRSVVTVVQHSEQVVHGVSQSCDLVKCGCQVELVDVGLEQGKPAAEKSLFLITDRGRARVVPGVDGLFFEAAYLRDLPVDVAQLRQPRARADLGLCFVAVLGAAVAHEREGFLARGDDLLQCGAVLFQDRCREPVLVQQSEQ